MQTENGEWAQGEARSLGAWTTDSYYKWSLNKGKSPPGK